MRLLYLLPHFDEDRNSFSKLLVPLLEEMQRRDIPFEIWSANRAYSGRFRSSHKACLPPKFKYEFVTFPISLIWTSFLAWKWQRKNPRGLIHNIGGGSSLVHDLITAHACHAQYLKVKWLYGEISRILLNPIHFMILVTEWFNYIRSPKVIAVSSFVEEGLKRHHPALKGSLVIENALDLPARLPTPKREAGFHILFASNNHQHKGLGALLEAMTLAKEHNLNWHLKIAGQDPFENHWKKEVSRRGLDDCVDFLGHTNQLQEIMAASDIYCMPSKYEAFGMVYLEAAQVGCPSYGTPTGVLESLYSLNKGPALVPHPASGTEVFAGLRYWSEHPEELRSLGHTMQLRAKNFSAQSMKDKTINLYAELSEIKSS